MPAVLAVVLTTSSGRGPTRDAAPKAEPPRSDATATLFSAGSRYVGDPIPIMGYTANVSSGKHTLVLEEFSTSQQRWSARATMYVDNGGYRFPAQHSSSPGSVKFRTVLFGGGDIRLQTSNVITVQVVPLPVRTAACNRKPSRTTCSPPPPLVEQQAVDAPNCPLLVVTTHVETRTVNWQWDAARGRWVKAPTPWEAVPGSGQPRPAGVADCVKVVDRVPDRVALPDLRIKDLTACGEGDKAVTGGTCFAIVPSASYAPDFPALTGRKLLKFPVITVNVGDGPGEIVADRSGVEAGKWQAYQNFYDARGDLLGSVVAPPAEFYLAGDGHEHWHVRDFDDYELLDASGTQVARAEKHGYCMQDNTTYGPMEGEPGVPAEPVYPDGTACGDKLPDALTIVHGLSVGWGDTYPISLPDQAVDITGLPDGVYTARAHADARGLVKESNEDNNAAAVRIRIIGDTVEVLSGTSTGGVS